MMQRLASPVCVASFLAPLALLASLAFLAAGCGNAARELTSTRATIAFTDAPSDDIDLFEVGVTDIRLIRADDSTVSALTRATRVDFAELASVTELAAGVTIPVGIYKGMTMTLQFADALVCLAGKTTPATVLDALGNPITGDVRVDVGFATTARPQALLGRNHLFVLDLALDESLTVDLANNRVTFSPVITATADPTSPKPVVVTAVLRSVDGPNGRLEIERRTAAGETIGSYTVVVTPATVYQINGASSTGSTGLAALATVPQGARVWVQGTLSTQRLELTAVAIEAGAGTPGNGQDRVIGHIVARDLGAGSNAALTVLGRSFDQSSGVRQFNTAHTVQVDQFTTKVLKRLGSTGLSTDSLNVGQRVIVFGNLSGTFMNATHNSSVVRMLKTSVWGTATGSPTGGTLTLDLARIGPRAINLFDFTVGGTAQSDPNAFTVDTGALSITGIQAGSKIRATGFVNPVDVTTDRDFTAAALVNRSTTGALLVCQWVPATTSPITSSAASQIVLDVSSASISVAGDGFGTTTLSNSPVPAKIEPLLAAGIYRIVEEGAVELHLTFDTFVESIGSRINPQSPVFRIAAIGTFDDATQTLKALAASVILL